MIELSVRKSLRSSAGDLLLHIDGAIEAESLVTLYGPSGAGKTTLLRILAGLLTPDEGRIVVDGTVWLDTQRRINRPPQQRSVGLVFQDYALFPTMTVRENLRFALAKGQPDRIVHDLMEIVELEALYDRKPDTLSGGQRQRVALARALVQRPRLLLLDEPLSALDHAMRRKLQDYILQVHRTYGLTTLLVSHDPSEILRLSDRMLVIEHGQLIRRGTPAEILTHRQDDGSFQLVGEVVAVERQGATNVVTVLIGRNVVVVSDTDDATVWHLGDRVIVASEMWSPTVRKIK